MKKTTAEPIRVGMIMGKWVGGGVEAVIMNYYRNINRNKIQFDFICDEDSTNIPYEEIESLGGRVIICPPYQKLFKYIKELKKIFKENQYQIVHSNINTLSVFPLYAAKRVGVPIRIAHSHSTTSPKEFKRNLLKSILKIFSKVNANRFFACSETAGIYQFGNKAFKNGEIIIINNAIDVEKFSFNPKERIKTRNELGIKKETYIIGHVGRFVTTKNQNFILKIFSELCAEDDNSKLLLIGQGPLLESVKKKAKELKIDERVIFLGQKKEIEKYYQIMDLFIFPSLYEGLGLSAIEAQCSGLPCIMSTNIPKDTGILNNTCFLDLESPIYEWVQKIREYSKKERIMNIEAIQKAGFDIKKEIAKLEKLYIEYSDNIKQEKGD